jgi:hypothetical protein
MIRSLLFQLALALPVVNEEVAKMDEADLENAPGDTIEKVFVRLLAGEGRGWWEGLEGRWEVVREQVKGSRWGREQVKGSRWGNGLVRGARWTVGFGKGDAGWWWGKGAGEVGGWA